MQLRLDLKRVAAVLAVLSASIAPFACSSGVGSSTAPPNPECHAAFSTETITPSGALESASGGTITCGTSAGGGGGSFKCEALKLAPSCVSCVQSKCASTITACLGSGWRSGQFGGACADFANCACPCASTSCVKGCTSKATPACTECLDDVEACIDGPCEDECSTTVDAGGDTSVPMDTALPSDTGGAFDTALPSDTGAFDTGGGPIDTSTGSGCWFIDAQFAGSSCRSCMGSSCSSQMSSCAGSSWQQGNFAGGTCAAYLGCICKCSSSDQPCQTSCNSVLTSACSSCFETALTCREMSCSGSC